MKTVLIILLCAISVSSIAQTKMYIHQTEGKIDSFSISEIMSISFRATVSDSIQGLVAYYPFDGNANDQSGNGHHGIVYGAILTTNRFGIENRAYKFDGIDDYILATLNELKSATGWTISFWAKVDDFNQGGPFSLLTATPDYLADGFWWHFWDNGTVYYRVKDEFSGLSIRNNVAVPIQEGIWQYHTVTVTQNLVVHYINAVSVFIWNTFFDLTKLNSDDLQLRIGEGYNFENCYAIPASIDQVFIFNRVLTDVEILELYSRDD